MVFKQAAALMAMLLVLGKNGNGSSSSCCINSFHIKDSINGHALETRTFKTSTIENDHIDCFLECAMDCRCLSFNVCGKQCQINADEKDMKNNSLTLKYGCSYYKIQTTIPPVTFQPCCLMSNPCLNGGTCSSGSGLKNKRRSSCLCKPGFYGNFCETKDPRSCADFMAESVKPLSGEYKILDDNDKPFSVYCDFDSELGFAWTMLLSFSRGNALSVQTKGLLDDLPVNEHTLNWESYRLSLSRVNSVRQRSTHWRATCGFDEYGVDYQEYIRVNLSVVQFSAYYFNGYNGPTACQTIEFMNFWGSECYNCNFALYHKTSLLPLLAFDNSKTWSQCTFDLLSKQHYCDAQEAHMFAVNVNCYDPRSRCQMAISSTTQHWFGAKVVY